MLFLICHRLNLLQSFNYAPYLFYKKRSKQRSIVSVYGLRMRPNQTLVSYTLAGLA
jgi:hypothetical protein